MCGDKREAGFFSIDFTKEATGDMYADSLSFLLARGQIFLRASYLARGSSYSSVGSMDERDPNRGGEGKYYGERGRSAGGKRYRLYGIRTTQRGQR